MILLQIALFHRRESIKKARLFHRYRYRYR
jgi:hypothetical protein